MAEPKKQQKQTKSDTDGKPSLLSRLRIIRDVPKHVDPPKHDGKHRANG